MIFTRFGALLACSCTCKFVRLTAGAQKGARQDGADVDSMLLQLGPNATRDDAVVNSDLREALRLSSLRGDATGSWAVFASGKVCSSDFFEYATGPLRTCKDLLPTNPSCGNYMMYNPYMGKCFCTYAGEACPLMDWTFYTTYKYTPPPPSLAPTPAPAVPTASPTPAPAPTSAPATGSSAAGSSAPATGSSATAVGDPHLRNLFGQRFDLAQPGAHVLVRVPKSITAEVKRSALLDVTGEVTRMSSNCQDMYIQVLNISGQWLQKEHASDFMSFHAQDSVKISKDWMKVGKVSIKVVRGKTTSGINYLNFLTQHLGSTGFAVGGLLGEDDHTLAATPSPECHKAMVL